VIGFTRQMQKTSLTNIQQDYIYTIESAAKNLLTIKGVKDFVEYDITRDTKLQQVMLERAPGARTVPQIFINDQRIGGCDDLYALEDQERSQVDRIRFRRASHGHDFLCGCPSIHARTGSSGVAAG
jgi:glutaredoxin 3